MRSSKFQDSSNMSSYNSKADRFNKHIFYYLKTMRKPVLSIDNYINIGEKDLINTICERYKINSIDFGNWTSQAQKYNFCLALFLSLYDLQKVLKFKNDNLGQKSLKIGYGSRGIKNAYAHFEPSINYINLSRERRADKVGNSDKDQLIEFFSGFGSLAHEYGHFLDYFFGNKISANTMALTGGVCTLKPITLQSSPIKFNANVYIDSFEKNIINGSDPKNNTPRRLMLELFVNVFLDKNFRPTDFYKRLYKYSVDRDKKYWIRYNEIFARIFEIYVCYKLKKLGITNKILVSEGRGKYAKDTGGGRSKNPVYLTFSELEKVEHIIDELIKSFNNLI